mmetsp:Transcript_60662/g.125549  ORF Transcript_60662/g.125549 Transcript_60662/m.125549 type:complete len:260 (-) Transcript_60662:339-1118(-)
MHSFFRHASQPCSGDFILRASCEAVDHVSEKDWIGCQSRTSHLPEPVFRLFLFSQRRSTTDEVMVRNQIRQRRRSGLHQSQPRVGLVQLSLLHTVVDDLVVMSPHWRQIADDHSLQPLCSLLPVSDAQVGRNHSIEADLVCFQLVYHHPLEPRRCECGLSGPCEATKHRVVACLIDGHIRVQHLLHPFHATPRKAAPGKAAQYRPVGSSIWLDSLVTHLLKAPPRSIRPLGRQSPFGCTALIGPREGCQDLVVTGNIRM